jgi:hypothetical protein
LIVGISILLTMACLGENPPAASPKPPTSEAVNSGPEASEPEEPVSEEVERWTPQECDGFRFVTYEFYIKDQFSSTESSFCSSPLLIRNIDDTIIVRAYVQVIETDKPIYWMGMILGPDEEGEFSAFASDNIHSHPQKQEIRLNLIAVWIDLPQCDWISQEEAYYQVSRELNQPCRLR